MDKQIDWDETERVANLMSAGELWYAESGAIKAAKHFDALAGTELGHLGGFYHDQASVYRKVRRQKEGRKAVAPYPIAGIMKPYTNKGETK